MVNAWMMEWIDGVTLEEWLQQPIPRSKGAYQPVARSVEFVHRHAGGASRPETFEHNGYPQWKRV